jgi:hypothetical protein
VRVGGRRQELGAGPPGAGVTRRQPGRQPDAALAQERQENGKRLVEAIASALGVPDDMADAEREVVLARQPVDQPVAPAGGLVEPDPAAEPLDLRIRRRGERPQIGDRRLCRRGRGVARRQH